MVPSATGGAVAWNPKLPVPCRQASNLSAAPAPSCSIPTDSATPQAPKTAKHKSIYFNNVANIVCLFWFNDIDLLDSALYSAGQLSTYAFRIGSSSSSSSILQFKSISPPQTHLCPLTPGATPNHTPGHTPPVSRANIATAPTRRFSSLSTPSASFKQFVISVITQTQLPPTDVSLALLYIFRLKHRSLVAIQASANSEYRVFSVALILANKFLDDNTYTNKTWSEITHLPLREISQMEIEFLDNMNHSLLVSQQEWAAWQGQLKTWLNIYYHGMDPALTAQPSVASPSPASSYLSSSPTFNNAPNSMVASLASPPRCTSKRSAQRVEYPSKRRNLGLGLPNGLSNGLSSGLPNGLPNGIASAPPLLSPTVNAPRQSMVSKAAQGHWALTHPGDPAYVLQQPLQNTPQRALLPQFPVGQCTPLVSQLSTVPTPPCPQGASQGLPQAAVQPVTQNGALVPQMDSQQLIHNMSAHLMLLRTPPGMLLSNAHGATSNNVPQYHVLTQQKVPSTPQNGYLPSQGTAGLQFELEHYVPYQQLPAVYQFSSPTTVTVSYWRNPQHMNYDISHDM